MSKTKRIIVNNTASIMLELDVPTTVSFHIYERNQATLLDSISYRIEKVSGRTSSIIQAWATLIVDNTDNLYTFDINITGVTASDGLSIVFKVTDIDGVEAFREINDIKVLV